jgi:hypothetical protein
LLTVERLQYVLADLSTHFRRMIFGESGLALSEVRTALIVGVAAAAVAVIGALLGRDRASRFVRPAVYFGGIWLVLCVAPTTVAGYASPRHMYLASSSWAILLGMAFEVVSSARPARVMRPAAAAAIAAVTVSYVVLLIDDVRAWDTRSMVSRRAVTDIEREALRAVPGTLIIAGAPRRSWEYALPHALRRPFTGEDLTQRVTVISDSASHCCPADRWEAYTRGALRAWLDRDDRPPIVALYWNPQTGHLSRLDEHGEPFLRPLMRVLLETDSRAALDEAIRDTLRELVAQHQ